MTLDTTDEPETQRQRLKHAGTIPPDEPEPIDEEDAIARELMNYFGFFGHYMHFYGGGRSGRAPIICLIAKNGGQMSQQELGANFDLKPGSLSEILSKCEAAGLIERKRCPEDQRKLMIRLTEKGTQQAEIDQATRIEFRQKAFSALSQSERAQLIETLEKIKQTWETLND